MKKVDYGTIIGVILAVIFFIIALATHLPILDSILITLVIPIVVGHIIGAVLPLSTKKQKMAPAPPTKQSQSQPFNLVPLWDRFKKDLQDAIKENAQYNILNGAPAKGVGELKLYQTNKGTTLVVGIESHEIIGEYLPDGSCGYCVIQLNFGPEDNVIHITFGDLSYLTIVVSNEPEIDGAVKMVSEKVANYRLFTK